MNKKLVLLICILVFITFRYCNQESQKEIEHSSNKDPRITKLLNIANSYEGVTYKAGGASRDGMDCSGLVNTSFKQIGIQLARSSKAIGNQGKEINIEEVKPGDLLFFDIARLKGGINHVGMVTSVKDGNIKFIHSTTSKGVIVSSMNETYWKKEFIKARRIL